MAPNIKTWTSCQRTEKFELSDELEIMIGLILQRPQAAMAQSKSYRLWIKRSATKGVAKYREKSLIISFHHPMLLGLTKISLKTTELLASFPPEPQFPD